MNRAHEGETRPAKSRDSTMIAGGSEPSPEDLGSHDSAAIQRKGVDAQTQLSDEEEPVAMLTAQPRHRHASMGKAFGTSQNRLWSDSNEIEEPAPQSNRRYEDHRYTLR